MKDFLQVSTILHKALTRCEAGQEEYGEFNPLTDPRDLFEEMEEELLDSIVYHCFQIMKIREMRKEYLKLCEMDVKLAQNPKRRPKWP
jgi:hypothetical protein